MRTITDTRLDAALLLLTTITAAGVALWVVS